MDRDNQEEIDSPKNFDLEEASNASNESDNVVYAGTVEMWKLQELSEKAKLRPYITCTVISVWAISLIASALRLLSTGNFLLLVPAAIILVPLCIVLRFYFRGG